MKIIEEQIFKEKPVTTQEFVGLLTKIVKINGMIDITSPDTFKPIAMYLDNHADALELIPFILRKAF